jgi:hypothetical protein
VAASIPRSEWDAANELIRIDPNLPPRQQLVNRAKAAAGEETQLAYLLRGDYARFHARWPHVGLYRADGTLDESQVIAVAAYGLKPRRFRFPEFAAILHIRYGKDAIARKSLARWRQDVAALWHKAPAPAYAPGQKAQTPDGIYSVPATPRGRAGDHAALVERVYQLLRDYRAGTEVIVSIGELAASLHVDRRTVNTVLAELRQAGRISTRRAGQHSGLIVAFSDGIYSTAPAAEHLFATPEIETAPPAHEETDTHVHTHCVSLQDTAPDPGCPALVLLPCMGWHPPLVLPSLADLAAHYLDQRPADIGERCVSKRTGQITYRRTVRHFATLVTSEYPYTAAQAIEAYVAEQRHRKDLAAQEWQRFFARLRQMTNAELVVYIAGRCRTEAHELARDGTAFDEHQYRTRLKCAKQQLAWRGITMPGRTTRIAQQAHDDAKHAQQARQRLVRPTRRPIACQPVRYEQPPLVEPGAVDYAVVAATITARLKSRQEAAHELI